MSHDRITQLRGGQNALLKCRLQISHEKSERFGSTRNRPHGEAVDIRHARRQRVARHGQTKLAILRIGDDRRFGMQNRDCIAGVKLDLLAALR